MLGEQIMEERGQITGTRVLPGKDGGAKVEVSFQADGTVLGEHGTDMGTYVSVGQPDGSLRGEGQGVVMTEHGDTITYHASGIGHFTGRGTAAAWRGAIYFQTSSQRLARLNGTVGVFEYDTDESGKAESRTYEWK